MKSKIFVILLSVFLFACGKEEKTLSISAASSLTELMKSVEELYEKKTGTDIIVNLASSGTLKRQIEQGAPVDLFISASSKKMDDLSSKGLIDEESRYNILKNKLSLIVSKDSLDKIKDLNGLMNSDIKLSIGEPKSVPAGSYAKDSLEYYKIWDSVEKKIIYAKNVKQVLYYVESGEIDAGIVYSSDAIHIKNSKKILDIDSKSHKNIVYPIAIIKESQNKKNAVDFLEFMKTEEIKKEIVKAGFYF